MIRSTHRLTTATRRAGYGVVFAEFNICMLFILIPLLAGIWEVGRAVQVQQIVATSAREGARLAAQGRTIDINGAQTDIRAAILPPANLTSQPNVKAAVMQSLAGSGLTGLTWADVVVTFAFTDGAMGNTDPYQGTKNQGFKVEVTVQYDDKVRWVNTGVARYLGITQLKNATQWRMLMDDPFTVNTDIPTW